MALATRTHNLSASQVAGPDRQLPSGLSRAWAAATATCKRTRPSALILPVCLSGLLVVGMIVAGTGALLSTLHARALDHEKRELRSLALAVAEQTDRTFQAIELVQNSLIGRTRDLGSGRMQTSRDRCRPKTCMSTRGHDGRPAFRRRHVLDRLGWDADQFLSLLADQRLDYVKALLSDPKATSSVSGPQRNPTTGIWTIYLRARLSHPMAKCLA